jgi:ribosome-binding factor A
MSRRTERIASLIQETVGQLLLSKLSDPRVDPALTSITHVEVPEDLLTAKIYISVIGTEAQQRRTLTALQHASGHIQELMAREITLRNTPILSFSLDVSFKKTLETYLLISKAMEEIRQKEAAKQAQDASAPQGQGGEPEGSGQEDSESSGKPDADKTDADKTDTQDTPKQ